MSLVAIGIAKKAVNIDTEYYFATDILRDDYFVANPDKLKENIYVIVDNQLQRRLNGAWVDSSMVVKGDKGDKGDTGEGVAEDGTTGQVLTKVNHVDFNTEWTTIDKYTQVEVNGLLDNKVDKVMGKVLSDNNYTNGDKNKVNAVNIAGDGGLFLSNDGTYKSPAGSGDMTKAQYDPDGIQSDIFDIDNLKDSLTRKIMTSDERVKLTGVAENANNYTHPANHLPSIITQDENNRFVTDVEKTTWNNKQDALGFTAENNANKKTTLTDSDVDYPTTKAVNTALGLKQDTLVSNTNIKTINNTTVLGSGDFELIPSSEKNAINGVATLDGDSKLVQNLDATKITSGTIDLARLPHGSLERLVTVADEATRFLLTIDDVQNGDTVKQIDTNIMYFVVDDTKLDSADGYTAYTASRASAVDWSGVENKPATFAPAAHIHDNVVPTGVGEKHGFMSHEDKAKLDGVANNANNYAHPDNHLPAIITQDENNRFVTDVEKNTWNGKQDALGFTAEDSANKKTTLTDSDVDYPSTKAVNTGLGLKQNTLVNGDITDNLIGDRTIDDTTVADGDTNKMGILLSWLANMIKSITGKDAWRTAPAITLEATKTHVDNKDVHFEKKTVNDVTGNDNVLDTIHTDYIGGRFDIVAKDGVNVRIESIIACYDGTNVEFTSYSTVDLGDTSGIVFKCNYSSGIRLLADVSSGTWSVRILKSGI